jgi:prepilin-type N-terminal cleavage/methylation domain-containing protein
MIKTRKHKAFSLIEISVVIVIIGILIAGISSGIELYDDYRFKVAQNLTKNSPVSRIPDLKLWLETTSEKAFKIGTTTNINDYKNIALPDDQQDIGVWQEDVSTKYPQEIAYQMNNFKPSYVKNGIGGLPSLYFDGKNNVNGDFMSFDGSLLSVWEDGFTVFVVERRTALPTTENYQFLFFYLLLILGA